MLTSQNYKTSISELSVLSKTNPFRNIYPVAKEYEPILPKNKLENCFCSDRYMSNEYFSVNIYEVTWVKYNLEKSIPISNYVRTYLPIYTKMHYDNRKLLKSK